MWTLSDHSNVILVDAHSKCPEVIPMFATTLHHTTEALRFVFSRFGLAGQLVPKNGPQFMYIKQIHPIFEAEWYQVTSSVPHIIPHQTIWQNTSFRNLSELLYPHDNFSDL